MSVDSYQESIAGEISNKSNQSWGLGHTRFFFCCSSDFFGELFCVEGDKFQKVVCLARPEKLNTTNEFLATNLIFLPVQR